MFKKVTSFVFRYALVVLIANLLVGILSLIFKVSLITVQGPTMFSRISGIIIYYVFLSVASFLIFKNFRKKQNHIQPTEIAVFLGLIFVIHTVLVFAAEWSVVWFLSTGSLPLAELIYNGGGYLESIREIPRFYYFVALALEDLCIFTFSLIGYHKGSNLRMEYDNNSPLK